MNRVALALALAVFCPAVAPHALAASARAEDILVTRPTPCHSGDALCVAFSPDGETLVSGGLDEALRFWNAATGEATGTIDLLEGVLFQGVPRWVSFKSIAFSPDGSSIVATGTPELLLVFDVRTKRELLRVFFSDEPISASFSPDGSSIVVLLRLGEVQLLDAKTGKLQKTYDEPQGAMSLAVSDAAIFVASPGRVTVLDGGFVVRATVDVAECTSAGTTFGRVAARGSTGAVVAGLDVLVFDLHGTVTKRLGVGCHLDALAWAPDGKALVVATTDARLELLPLDGPRRALGEHVLTITNIAWSPDGSRIASSSLDSSVRLWDTARKQEIGHAGHAGTALWVSFLNGELVTVGRDRRVLGWGPENKPRVLVEGSPNPWEFASAGKMLAIRMEDFVGVACVESTTAPLTFDLEARCTQFDELAVSRQGDLATAFGTAISLWQRPETGKIAAERLFVAAPDTVTGLDFSPDGKRLLVGQESCALVYEIATGYILARLPYTAARRVSFTSEDRVLLRAGEEARIVDLNTGKLLLDTTARLCDAGPGAKRLAAVDDDVARIIDIDTGAVVALHPLDAIARCTEFDGERLVMAFSDGSVLIWKPELP